MESKSSRLVTIPFDESRAEVALEEAVMLVKQLGGKVRGLSHRTDPPALVVLLPVSRRAG